MKAIRAASVLLMASVAAAAAEPVFPPGAGVGLEPPSGMEVTQDFLGFQKGRASILINELPKVAYQQVGGMGDAMAARMQNGSRVDFKAGGATGFLVRGRQELNGAVFRKWAVVLDAPQETVMVTAQVPVDDATITDAAVEAALHSIVFRAPPSLADKVAALPFTVGDLAGFRIVGVLMGATLSLTEGPNDTDVEGKQPNIVIATSLDRPAPDTERLAFAKASLQALTAIRNTTIKDAKLFDDRGAPWAEVEATAVRGRASVPVKVIMFMRFNKERDTLSVICTDPVADETSHVRQFRRLALSVAPKA